MRRGGLCSKTEEVIELAKVAAAQGGIYDTHMRDESSYTIGVMGAIRESITMAEGSGHPERPHLAHQGARAVPLWGKSDEAIQLIREAQAEGVQISADQYRIPRTYSLTASLVPRWAQVEETLKC